MHASRKIEVSFEELGSAEGATAPVDERLNVASGGAHARALQHRLLEAYDEGDLGPKLPIRQRVAVIAGATLSLWLLIGGTVYLAL